MLGNRSAPNGLLLEGINCISQNSCLGSTTNKAINVSVATQETRVPSLPTKTDVKNVEKAANGILVICRTYENRTKIVVRIFKASGSKEDVQISLVSLFPSRILNKVVAIVKKGGLASIIVIRLFPRSSNYIGQEEKI